MEGWTQQDSDMVSTGLPRLDLRGEERRQSESVSCFWEQGSIRLRRGVEPGLQ